MTINTTDTTPLVVTPDLGPPIDQRLARRDVRWFLLLVGAIVAVTQAVMISSGRDLEEQAVAILVMMAAPALVSTGLRLVRREGFVDVSFRPKFRQHHDWYLLAWLLPVSVGAVAYGVAWATGVAPLGDDDTLGSVAALLVGALVVGVPISMITALGEEVGWRGYLLPRLVQAGVRRPVVVTNAIWWVFHVPLILGGIYASGPVPVGAALVFGVTLVAIGTIASWSRLRTGSVWPAVLLHASWNQVIQSVFDEATVGAGPRASENVWVGESGLLVAAAAMAAMALVSRRRPSARNPESRVDTFDSPYVGVA